jgi:hypothetical protein
MIERLPVTIEHRGDQIGDHERGVGARCQRSRKHLGWQGSGRPAARTHERACDRAWEIGVLQEEIHCLNPRVPPDCPGMSMTIYRERLCQACLLGQVRTDDYAGVVACEIRTRVATARGQCPRLAGSYGHGRMMGSSVARPRFEPASSRATDARPSLVTATDALRLGLCCACRPRGYRPQ